MASIDDEVYQELQRIASQSRRPLQNVVNDLLRAGLEARAAGLERPKRELGRLRGRIRILEDLRDTPAELY